jgi:hypothetical protein
MSDFKPTYILKILHIIHYRLLVGELLSLGLNYSQIAELISYVMQEGLVIDHEDSGLKLSDSGLLLLEKLNKELYPSNSQAWILPSDENRIPKIDKFDIYLPKKRKYGE